MQQQEEMGSDRSKGNQRQKMRLKKRQETRRTRGGGAGGQRGRQKQQKTSAFSHLNKRGALIHIFRTDPQPVKLSASVLCFNGFQTTAATFCFPSGLFCGLVEKKHMNGHNNGRNVAELVGDFCGGGD